MGSDSNAIGEIIAASARLGMLYAERLLTGVSADHFARYAVCGGTVVESNHPCFILGHLSLYAPRVIGEVGGEASGIQPPEGFGNLFSKDAKCVDDPEGTVYPSMDVVVEAFRKGHERVVEILPRVADEVFRVANPNEAMREKFPTMGAMHAFYLSGHLMVHMGQFSAWRRAMGLPAA